MFPTLQDYLAKCVTPFHCVEESTDILKAHGYKELILNSAWNVKEGGKYYINCFGTMLVALTIGNDIPLHGIRISAAHTDWPCLYLKPKSEEQSGKCLKVHVEPYGGLILSTWFDRPLSCAGAVMVKSDLPFHPTRKLIDFKKPVFYIPNLPIHVNRDVNQNNPISSDTDVQPICMATNDNTKINDFLLHQISAQLEIPETDISAFDLLLYNPAEPTTIGFNRDFLSSPRLDNLTSCYACLSGLINGSSRNGINCIVLYDNEEIGSRTKAGADSGTLNVILEKCCSSLGYSRAEYLDSLGNGFLLSCDVAHAVHPNHVEKYDRSQCAYLGHGVTLKLNYEQKYSTSCNGTGTILQLCEKYSIPVQQFMNKPGSRGGSTLGAFVASALSIPSADVGVPILAMHSAQELMAITDQDSINDLVLHFMTE